MRFVLHVEGAEPADLSRGVAAAVAVLDAAGVTPLDGARAIHGREHWDDAGFPDDLALSDAQQRAAEAMDKAYSAAVGACCAAWRTPPGRSAWEVRESEESLSTQLIRQARHWVDEASPQELWHVLQRGGLSARIIVVDGLPQATVVLDDKESPLARLGILGPEMPADEALALYAQKWGATEPPAKDSDQLQWFTDEGACLTGARRHLREEVDRQSNLFEAIARRWTSA